MLDVLNIPLPPMPGGALGMLIGLVIILAGVVLLMIGRVVVWRALAAIVLGAVGIVLGGWLGPAMGLEPTWSKIIGGVLGALLGAGLARVYWALTMAMGLAAGGLLFVLLRVLTPEVTELPAGFEAEGLTASQWLTQTGRTLWAWLAWLHDNHSLPTIATEGLVFLLSFVVGIARPVFTRVLATSALGAAACLAGGGVALRSLKQDLDLSSGRRGWVLLGMGLALALIGIFYQYRAETRSRKKTDQTGEAAPPPKKGKGVAPA